MNEEKQKVIVAANARAKTHWLKSWCGLTSIKSDTKEFA
jgi:hypothetical protein